MAHHPSSRFRVSAGVLLVFASCLMAARNAPVPFDLHELVKGNAELAASPRARAAALALFERAKQNSDLYMPGTPPFVLTANFNAGGNAVYTGAGQLTQTWVNRNNWGWSATLGDYSQTRLVANGTVADNQQITAIPMRVQTLRSEIFWPVGMASNATIRSAAAQWNGRAVTCILAARSIDPANRSRQWQETEYCIDNASGLLQVHSPAPGSFTVYGYQKNLELAGRTVPDKITVYCAGSVVLDAQINVSPASGDDLSAMTQSDGMVPGGIVLANAPRFPKATRGPDGTNVALPAIVHVTLTPEGKVSEAEVTSAADPSLAERALDFVKSLDFPKTPAQQRETYINVRFTPSAP